MPMDDPHALYALFEYTAALPRASLFSNWEIVTNQEAALAAIGRPIVRPRLGHCAHQTVARLNLPARTRI